MKRLLFGAGLGVALLAATAFAAIQFEPHYVAQFFKAPVYVGSSSVVSTAHAITESLGGSYSIDFGGVTDSCEDSAGQTLTGAAVGDVCEVGTPATLPSSTSWITCYVSAANTVKVRHCSHGASGNPAAATYYVRTFSSQ